MTSSVLAALWQAYQFKLSLVTFAGILVTTLASGWLARLVPAIAAASKINRETFKAKLAKPAYAANHKWNRKWAILFQLAIFLLIMPFCVTLDAPKWWRVPVDLVMILMVYDFVYYLTHRFLFHAGGPFDGPLMWMHAVHHRQHNPCRMDASYIHPLEVAIGLGLYVMTIWVLARLLGPFHVGTVIVTFVAFSQINLHNHNLWEADEFPFRYLNYLAKMHHNHHARFTGGNYATISLFYDWLFGTLDHGDGVRVGKKKSA